MTDAPLVLWLADLGRQDGDKVGGKNASLGEMISSLLRGGHSRTGRFGDHCERLRPKAGRRSYGRAGRRTCRAGSAGRIQSTRTTSAKA